MERPRRTIKKKIVFSAGHDTEKKSRASVSVSSRSRQKYNEDEHLNISSRNKADLSGASKAKRRAVADINYPDEDFDPVNGFEQDFENLDFTKKDLNKEKTRARRVFEELRVSKLADTYAILAKTFSPKKASCQTRPVTRNTVKSENKRYRLKQGMIRKKSTQSGLITPANKLEYTQNITFCEPISRNIVKVDELQLCNAPLVSDDADDVRICRALYNHYPNGIHGYQRNETDTSYLQEFQLLCKLLPGANHPDLLYYTLYLMYPNSGTQKEWSEKFPFLLKRFTEDGNERKLLLKFEEKWKPVVVNKVKQPLNYKHPCSHGNFFLKSIDLSSNTEPCSRHCYKNISKEDMTSLTSHLDIVDGADQVNMFFEKFIKEDCEFFNTLALSTEQIHVENFCQVVKTFTSKNCGEWFKKMLTGAHRNSGPSSIKSYEDRFLTFKKTMTSDIKKRQKQRKIDQKRADDEVVYLKETDRNTFRSNQNLTPCCHFGPCGPDAPSCTCGSVCSVYCQCDSNCSRKFPGCECPPNSCGTSNCPCYKLGFECIDSTCGGCITNKKQGLCCKNSQVSRGIFKRIKIMDSTIAGKGGFIIENAEQGDLIGEYVGEVISDEETERRGHLYNLGMSYIFNLENGSVDATRAGNGLRFINNSKQANCFAKLLVANGEARIGFFAVEDILAGTELTVNYQYKRRDAENFFKVAPEDRVPKIQLPDKKAKGNSTGQKRVSVRKARDDKKELLQIPHGAISVDQSDDMCIDDVSERKIRGRSKRKRCSTEISSSVAKKQDPGHESAEIDNNEGPSSSLFP